MAVTVNNRWIRAVASAAQTVFTYDFPITAKESIEIYQIDGTTQVATLLVFSTNYTLTGIGDAAGGTFVLTAGATLNDIYVADGITPYARTTDFAGKTEITTSSINNQYDDLTKQTQQNRRGIDRSLSIPITDDLDTRVTEFPEASVRASKYAAFDASGDLTVLTASSGAANPGGSDTEIQYNNNAVLDGISGFTTNGSTTATMVGTLTVTGTSNVDNIRIDGNAITSTNSNGDIVVTPNGTGITDFSGSTEAIHVPTGTTAQRPGSPSGGYTRFNTTTNELETYDGTSWVVASGGPGDVVGPGSALDGGVVLFDGTTGKLVKDSGIVWPIPTGGFVNKIINPSMDIWQRASSFTSIANGAYGPDRWKYGKAGLAVHDLSQSTDFPTPTEADHQFNFSSFLDCTTIDASIAAGDFVIYGQSIEGYNITGLSGTSFTISFWVKAFKTGTYCVSLRNAGSDRSYIVEYTISSSQTWEKKSLLVTDFSAAGGTWSYKNGLGLSIRWAIACGSTFHTTADAWNTGNFFATSSQVNGVDSTSNEFRLTGVQVEKGVSAGAYDSRSWKQEFGLCERYYQKSYEYDADPGTASAGAYSTMAANPGGTQFFGTTALPTQMRVSSLTTQIFSFAGTANKWSNGAGADQAGTASLSFKDNKLQSGGNSSALTAATSYLIHWTAASEL